MQRSRAQKPSGPSRGPPVTRRVSSGGSDVMAGARTYARSVATSSRSSATSVRHGGDVFEGVVGLPLTLFEYNFPRAHAGPLPPSDVFTDPEGVAFMTGPQGQRLRAQEHGYARIVRQYINRAVPLAAANVLVLGSGSSKQLTNLLGRGVATATFVDTSARALSTLRSHVDARGLHATVDVHYVNEDAWDFVGSVEGGTYDLIIMVKCTGLILSSGPNRRAVDLFDMLVDAARPGASIIVDHHVAFSLPEQEGKPIGDLCGRGDYDVATIAGRYSADVAYNWFVDHPDASLASTFVPIALERGVQTWQVFHFRVAHETVVTTARALSSRIQTPPRAFASPPVSDFDSTIDAMIPINHKGVKVIPSSKDVLAHDVTRARPKIDGLPGVMVLEGSSALFLSPVVKHAIPLTAEVSPRMVVMAELVHAREGGSVFVVTGVVAIGTARADPNSFITLQRLVPVFDKLLAAGIVANSPDLMRALRGDELQLRSASGRSLTLPVDGVSVVTGDTGGRFFKPLAMYTVDAKSDEIGGLIAGAAAMLGLAEPMNSRPASAPGVHEYAFNPETREWVATRLRRDKTWSDTPGAVLHTVVCALSAHAYGFTGTVQDVAKKILA
ncbi:hypothetical protein [Magnaporthe oryzae polymycovirus 1]|uniref:Methyltransferase n=1 Tax=Magnaporthe oryzae polymycovirus 1 TaxID=2509266 RepID=A0A410TEM9_9VIRU|nr:hypothetical protein KM556_s3gp1 [Magnaporthe oryzae polymycovirus 1]QAU09251.1 hypothetical protein [Magnaporthe oryzae polymycovirus 1]